MAKNKLLACFAVLLVSLAMVSVASAKKASKEDICHFDKDVALFKLINVSGNSVGKHFSNHGDVYPGDFYADTDGDGFGAGTVVDDCPNPGTADNADDAFPDDPAENSDSDGDGIGDNGDECPDEAGPAENDGCPLPDSSLGSDLIVGFAGEHGHTGKVGMLFGDGAGNFTINIAGIGGFSGQEVAVGDLNHDGVDDIAMTQTNGPAFVALGDFADGLQTSDFTSVGSFSELSGNCCDRTRVLKLADVDGDGALDMAVTQWTKIAVMLGNGDGTFGAEIKSPAYTNDARGMALGDVDGDGILDMVSNYAVGSWVVAVHRGNGDGSFQPGIPIVGSALAIPNTFLADSDGDGDLDIYTGALNGRMKIFENDGFGNFTLATDLETGTGNQGGLLVVADLNGDATPDAVAGIETNGFTDARVWLSNGSGGFDSADYGPIGQLARQGVLAEVNGDGKPDVAMTTVNIFGGAGQDGSVWIMPGNGDGTFGTPYQVTTYRNNFTIGAGNFD